MQEQHGPGGLRGTWRPRPSRSIARGSRAEDPASDLWSTEVLTWDIADMRQFAVRSSQFKPNFLSEAWKIHDQGPEGDVKLDGILLTKSDAVDTHKHSS